MDLSPLKFCAILTVLFAGEVAGLGGESVDYALSEHGDSWTHHPVLGDASFDAFERLPGNPVCRGTDEYRWPVNGSLFLDPVSRDWFLYVGWYSEGYAQVPEKGDHCIVYRSKDRGRTWQRLGNPIAGQGAHVFPGETAPIGGAPDVAVCFKDGRYHMSFDWATKGITWENIRAKDPRWNSGAAYAVSDSPEGPFRPVVAYLNNRDAPVLLGKYDRTYASTLLPRGKDWLALTLTDSNQHFGWGLLAQTASKPEGPWTAPKLVLHPQLDRYFPPLLEFFPAFVHQGYVYAPATSVAANRNFQVLFRAPIEKATDSSAWELRQAGSLWHAEPVESEYEGIWGQTFSGFVDDQGVFTVMFPSRDAKNRGTIGLARRPWDQPMRKRGFVISGHSAPGMSVLRHDTLLERLAARLKIHGTARVIWNHRGPFGADRPTSDCGLHPLMRTRHQALELTENSWRLMRYKDEDKGTEIARGSLPKSTERTVDLRVSGSRMALTVDGKALWEGPSEMTKGRVGLWAEAHSSVEATRFEVEGPVSETAMEFLHTEAILGAAQNMKDWEKVEKNPAFRYGEGVVSRADGVEVKWNFIGHGFAILAPTGPAYGKGELWLDGKRLGEIDFHAKQTTPSRPLYTKRDLPPSRYALKLKVLEGRVPVDVLRVFSESTEPGRPR